MGLFIATNYTNIYLCTYTKIWCTAPQQLCFTGFFKCFKLGWYLPKISFGYTFSIMYWVLNFYLCEQGKATFVISSCFSLLSGPPLPFFFVFWVGAGEAVGFELRPHAEKVHYLCVPKGTIYLLSFTYFHLSYDSGLLRLSS